MESPKLFRAAAVAALLFLCAPADAATWNQTGGPEGGSVTSLAHGGGRFYAAVAGVHRSDDGAAWTRTGVGLPDDAVVTSVAARDGDVIAAAGHTVYASGDGGATWSEIETGLPATGTISAYAFDGVFLLLHDAGGVQRLRLGDANDWAERTLPASSGNAILVDGAHLLATVNSVELFHSDDGAATWTPVGDDLPADFLTLLARTDEAVIAGGLFAQTLYRSTDHGVTWTEVATGIVNTFDRVGVASDATVIVAGGSGPEPSLLRSLDHGATWTPLDATGLPSFLATPRAAAAGGGRFVLGFGHGAWRSTDDGASWQAANGGIVGTTVSALGAAGSTIFATSPFGPPNARSADGGVTWTEMTPALPGVYVTAFDADGPLDVIAGSRDEGAYRTLDAGVTWDPVLTGLPTYGSTSGLRYQPLNGFATLDDVLFVATGGGPHFVAGDPHCGCSSVPSGDGVYRSANRGATWQRASNGLPINFVYLGEPILRPVLDVIATDDAVLATTAAHGVYRTTSLGASWSRATGAPGGRAFATLGGDQYLLGTDARIFRSTDGGLTWADLDADLPPEDFGTLIADGRALYASGAGFVSVTNGVYRSPDGAHWSPHGVGLDATPVVSLLDAGGTIFAGTVSRGVWMLEPFDLDGDGVIGFSDLLVVLGAWGECPPPPAPCPADLDDDGSVGFGDIVLLLANWG